MWRPCDCTGPTSVKPAQAPYGRKILLSNGMSGEGGRSRKRKAKKKENEKRNGLAHATRNPGIVNACLDTEIPIIINVNVH